MRNRNSLSDFARVPTPANLPVTENGNPIKFESYIL
jgi:hypothetical protein